MGLLSDARVLGCVSALAALAFSGSASAQSAPAPGSDEAKARERFEQGRALAEQERWAEACPALQQAHDLFATGGTALQLATCYEHMGELKRAYDLYQYILANAATEKFPERIRIAREHSADLVKRLEPEGPPAPQPTSPAPSPAPRPPPRDAPPPHSDESPSRMPVWIAYGVGGVGLVGGVFGAMALSQHGGVEDHCKGGVCPTSQEDAADSAVTKAWVSNVGFGVAIVGAAVGTILLVVRGSPASSKASATSIAPRARGVAVSF